MSDTLALKIGKRVRNLRKRCNFTQAQLAEKVNLTDESISRLETGKSIPSVEKLNEIAVVLNAEIKELFDFKEDKHIESKKVLIKKLTDLLAAKDKRSINLVYQIASMIFEGSTE